MSAGAYGMSMASNYNSRPRPAEVLVERRGRAAWSASASSSRTSGAASGPDLKSGHGYPKTFEGSMIALATPFRDGALDEDAYRALIELPARRTAPPGSSPWAPPARR